MLLFCLIDFHVTVTDENKNDIVYLKSTNNTVVSNFIKCKSIRIKCRKKGYERVFAELVRHL